MTNKEKAKDLVSQMTLEEKAGFCSGADFWNTEEIERLGLKKVMMCDGPHGLRKQEGESDHLGINKSIETICYPTASALASSFDREVLEELGEALGEECQAEHVGMLLGPGVNMKRSPLCGRNFEYFSEDPYLAGQLASAYIRSLQSKGVAACVKHFAANNAETMRMSGNSKMNERVLHEIYLPAFEASVKEGKTRGIMCAYNAINGVFCSENKELLNDTLRDRWGYDGFVVTDWGAVKDAANGVKAGVDLVMPGPGSEQAARITEAVRSGELEEAELNKTVERIVRFALDAEEFQKEDVQADREKYAQTSEKLSAECAVLLKNEGILPLRKETKTAFIGEFARKPRYQGSGSSFINVAKVEGAIEHISEMDVTFAKGFDSRETEPDTVMIEEAVRIAKEAETAVIFAGLPDAFETEASDRKDMKLPENQNRLIQAVAEVQPNTVVVLHCGAPVELPWYTSVKAVLCMYLGGQNVGKATVDLLYGEKNPCGKLAETWPLRLQDNPSYLTFPGTDGVVEYGEGIYIGYRYYDKKEMEVRFPFGYGLSYTEFLYSDLKISREEMTDKDTLTVTCKIKNTGSRKGKEAVQLYVGCPESNVPRPVRELKGFQKIELAPGEEKELSFLLDERSFAYYETEFHDWLAESGRYVIEIGASSRDIRLSGEVFMKSTKEIPYEYTLLSPVSSLGKTEKGRKILEEMMSQADHVVGEGMLGEGSNQAIIQLMMEMPLNSLVGFGNISMEQLTGMIMMLNER